MRLVSGCRHLVARRETWSARWEGGGGELVITMVAWGVGGREGRLQRAPQSCRLLLILTLLIEPKNRRVPLVRWFQRQGQRLDLEILLAEGLTSAAPLPPPSPSS